MWQLQSLLRISLIIGVIGRTESGYEIVEKGESTEFRCTFPNNSALITWQALSGYRNTLNLTTCNMASRKCTDQQPSVYQGRALRSVQGTYTMELRIISARINETRFRCLNDVGAISEEYRLEVYVWPTPPVCEPVKLDRYNLTLELTCTSSNVYPKFSPVINIIGPYDSGLIADRENSVCHISDLGSGSMGDVSVTCTWLIPIPVSRIPVGVWQISIAITAFVTNSTAVNKSAVASQNVTADLRLPDPVIYDQKCPVGPGVIGGYIKAGTSATCTCGVEEVGLLGGQAQWFSADGRNVGVNNWIYRSSTLNLIYNSSDPDVTYKCRGTSRESQNSYVTLTYKPKFPSPDCHVIVEKGQSIQLECPVQGSINSLTWQVWTSKWYEPVSTCNLTGACIDYMTQVYRGQVLNSSGVPKFTLDINGVRSNETQFRCQTDNGKVIKICTLEPYRWPSTITYGGMTLTNQYLEVTFSSVVFPDGYAVLHRRKTPLSMVDLYSNYCSLNTTSTDTNGDYIATCTWRLSVARMLPSNTFYVEMSVPVTNQTLVNRSPVVSNDILIQISSASGCAITWMLFLFAVSSGIFPTLF